MSVNRLSAVFVCGGFKKRPHRWFCQPHSVCAHFLSERCCAFISRSVGVIFGESCVSMSISSSPCELSLRVNHFVFFRVFCLRVNLFVRHTSRVCVYVYKRTVCTPQCTYVVLLWRAICCLVVACRLWSAVCDLVETRRLRPRCNQQFVFSS